MDRLGVYLLIFALAIVNDFLSKRENPLWGGIFPIGILLLFLLNFIFKWVDYTQGKFLFLTALALLLLFGGWANGRLSYNRKKSKEIEKISKMDL